MNTKHRLTQQYVFKCLIIIFPLIYSEPVSQNNLSQLFPKKNRIIQTSIPQSEWPIFKPLPIYSTYSSQYCPYPNNAYTQPFRVNGVDYVALSLKSCGMIIYSLEDPSNPHIELVDPLTQNVNSNQRGGSKINLFTMDYTRNMLWVAHSSGSIYTVNVVLKPFQLQLQFVTNNQAPAFVVYFIPGLHNYFMVFCFAQVQIYSLTSNNNSLNSWQSISNYSYYKTIILTNANNILLAQFQSNLNLLFVGSYSLGVLLYSTANATNKDISLTLIGSLKPTWSNLVWFYITKSNLIILQTDENGLFSFDGNACIVSASITQCSSLPQVSSFLFTTKSNQMYVDKSENFLYSMSRAQGLLTFDISQGQFTLFQIISISGDVSSITMNEDETLLFYTSAFQFFIFQKSSSTIVDYNAPNILLNLIQSYEYQDFKKESYPESDPCVYIDEKRNLIFVTRYQFGFTIIQKETDGVVKYLNNYDVLVKNELIDSFYFFKDYTIAYTPKNLLGLSIIDFTDPLNPVYIKQNLNFGISFTLFTVIQCNADETLCWLSSEYTGALFLDVTDILNPQLLSIFLSQTIDPSCAYSYSFFMATKKVFLLVVYNFGLILVDIEDPLHPKELSSLLTDDATDISVSKNEKYAFIACPLRGFIIVDISNLNDPSIVASVKLIGAALRLLIIHNEQYALVTTFENPGLFLIDIRDRLNPVLTQVYKRKVLDGFYGLALTSDESEGYLGSGSGIQLINLKNQIILHTEAYLYEMSSTTNLPLIKSIDISQVLYVGQQAYLYIIPLYENLPISIKNVQLYYNYDLIPLKSWMVFSPESNVLTLNIQNDALSQNVNGTFIQTTQQLIFQVYVTLSSQSFINTYLNIDAPTSALILKQCELSGYLDDLGMVTVGFNPLLTLNIDFINVFDATTLQNTSKMNDVLRFITYVLQHAIIYYPISFTVAPSLTFDPNKQASVYISSLQSQVNLYISLKDKSMGRFVNINYSGVLTVLSQQQDEIKLQGDTYKVNSILQQQLKFSSLVSQDQIIFQIVVQDGVNYDITINQSYSEITFISELTKVSVANNSSLSGDFNTQIASGEIYIQDRFEYQIPPNLFLGDNNLVLVYSAYIKQSNGDYQSIPLNYWLQFSPTDRIFSGSPSASQYNNVVYLKVVVTDNYSSTEQEFKIHINKIPFLYIFQLGIQILGPLIGLIGIWKYKFLLINLINRRKYEYSYEEVKAGETFMKQFLLGDNHLLIAEKILDLFMELVPQNEIKRQIYNLYSLQQTNNDEQNKSIFEFQTTQQQVEYQTTQQAEYQTQQAEFSNRQILLTAQNSNRGQSNKQIDAQRVKQNSSQKLIMESSSVPLSPQRSIFHHRSPRNNFDQRQQNNSKKNIEESNFPSIKPVLQLNSNYGIKAADQYDEIPNNLENTQDLQISKIVKDPMQCLNKGNSDMFSSKMQAFKQRHQQLFQKMVTKRIENQISNIQKYQTQKGLNEIQPQSEKKISTTISNQSDKMNLFDHRGNILFESIVEFILKQNENIVNHQQKCSTFLSPASITELKRHSSLSRYAFKGMLTEYILQQDQFTSYLFREIYKYAKNKRPTPDWYKEFCKITSNLTEISTNPIPNIEINKDEMIKSIKRCLFKNKSNHSDLESFEQVPINFKLLQETLKAYSLGFVSSKARITEKTTGEAIIIEPHQIKYITSFNKRENSIKKGFKGYLNNLFSSSLIQKPLIDNNKLPSWMKCNDVINNNLLLIGSPEKKDIGEYHIFIVSQSNYILRRFLIKVVDSNDCLDNIQITVKCTNTPNSNQQTSMQKDNNKNNSSYITPYQEVDQFIFFNQYLKDEDLEEKKPHENIFTV